MTTPGGVSNLPKEALTLDNLASRLQDMSGQAMRNRAVDRFPDIFHASTGGDPGVDFTPLGILTGIWSRINSTIANADPADIQGPDDLPPLFLDFIANLPVEVLGWVRTALERLAAIFGIDLDGLLDDGFDTADAIGAFIENVIDRFIDKIEEVTGLDLTWLHNLFEGLSETGSIVEQFYDAITGRGPTGTFRDISDWARGLLGFGFAGSGLPRIGTGQINQEPVNLLINPEFSSVDAFVPGMGIIWDGEVSHSGVGGSARFDVTGKTMSLIGNAVEVVNGDTIELSIWVRWLNLTATGTAPISLMIEAYDANDVVVPGAGQIISGVVSNPPTSSWWTQLSGNYVVNNPAVRSVAMRFNVTSNVTSGKVWFDDGRMLKPNLVKAEDVLGPLPGVGNLSDDWSSLLGALGGSSLQNIIDRLQFINPTGRVNAGALTNMADIPTILQERISGLPDQLADRLKLSGVNGADDFFARIRNAFDQGTGTATALNVRTSIGNLITAITTYPNTLANAQQMGNERYQQMAVLANWIVTPINDAITRIKDWWDHEDWVWW